MTNPMLPQGKPIESQPGMVVSAKPKRPVQAVCQGVKKAETSDLTCRKVETAMVEKASGYQRVGMALTKNMGLPAGHQRKNADFDKKAVYKAHIQEKKAKKLTYKRGNEEITLDDLFLKQNGENHG